MCRTSQASQTPWPIQTKNGFISPSTPLIRAVPSINDHFSDSLLQSCSNGHFFSEESAQWLRRLISPFNGAALYDRNNPNAFCDGARLLVTLGTYCQQSNLLACQKPECNFFANYLRQGLPPCNWTSFREWIITAIACWLSTPAIYGKIVEPVGLLDGLVCTNVFLNLGPVQSDPMFLSSTTIEPCLDITGVLSLLHWTSLAISQYSEGQMSEWVGFASNMNNQYQPYITQLLAQCRPAYQLRRFGICPSRLWNLLLSSRNQPMYIFAILQGLNQSSFPVSGAKHSSCTDQMCMFADDNSTNITQLHKCSGVSAIPPSPKCQQIFFSPDHLRKLLSKNHGNQSVSTAWDISKWEEYSTGKFNPLLLKPSSRYIAISHVWSDGTGIGINSPGNVNSCLAAYFARIAIRLGCSGLWWDSICVPSGREEKKKAMDRMLENYANATYMVVHDLSLVNFEWKDDGTPAIAVALSPWFTRGWTAAELFSTRPDKGSVKVLFKDPNQDNTEPLIKDLDTEVLTHPEHHSGLYSGRVPSHAHLSVSRIIRFIRRSMRGQEITSLPRLLSILKPRTTSWAKDRMILAALLCLPPGDVDTSRTSSQLTTDILRRMTVFPKSYLLHGEAPISPFGAFSWCPPSLFDLGKTPGLAAPYMDEGSKELTSVVELWDFGVLTGFFDVFSLSNAQDSIGILPYGSHPSVTTRIKIALGVPSNCLLLRTKNWSTEGQPAVNMWVLANKVLRPTNHPLFRNRCQNDDIRQLDNSDALFLRYIGCVICKEPKYSKHLLIRICFFGMDVDEEGSPLPTIFPFN